jgi:thiosulfate dehydrogenase [quinone] large subunit
MTTHTLSRPALIALTLLRVVIGWHFLYEGVAKLSVESWSAAGYLQQARGPAAGLFRSLAAQPNLLDTTNLVTMWGLTVVGVLLMLGLFTRLASLAGMAFVLMVYLAAPPWVGYFYALPSEGSYLIVNKNLVEWCALLVILMTGSGRFAGLDRILHRVLARTPRPAPAQAV